MNSTERHNSLPWCATLLRGLYAEGVRSIYISPGSRSTPLVLAAVTHPGFDTRAVLDERSAAFQALGSGRASGRPAVMICTSGTAPAHAHPAFLEARQAGIPLILISADRPPFLRGTGSSQTVDQIKLFGDTPLWFHELGEPSAEKRDLARLRLLARQAFRTAVDRGGPVHLNAPFRKPLEPAEGNLREVTAAARLQVEQPRPASSAERESPVAPMAEPIIDRLRKTRRPLILAGPSPARHAAGSFADRLAGSLEAPLIAEPGSHVPPGRYRIHRYDLLTRHSEFTAEHRPDLIVRTGEMPYSKCLLQWLKAHGDIPVLQFLHRDTWQQGDTRVDERILLHGPNEIPASLSTTETAWADTWARADRLADRWLQTQLAEEPALTDLHVLHALSGSADPSHDWMVSNSFTIRDLALARPAVPGPRIFVNRGTAGIDGILSTGLGISHASGRPLTIVAGDLAFLHDSNALLSLREAAGPVRIAVVNNGGGTIFRMLPIRQSAPDHYRTWFETPQQVDLEPLARAHGIPFTRIDSRDGLKRLQPPGTSGEATVELIEFRSDPDASMALRRHLWNSWNGPDENGRGGPDAS